jgi:hypothetical protein
MAKRPTRRGRRFDPAPVNALGWRRLPGSSRNYRNVSDPRQPIGTTISERQMANLSREVRLGQKISKEAYKTKVERGELSYANAATRLRQTNARNSRFIRGYLPDIAPKDKAVALKFYRVRYDSLSPAEKRRFGEMFTRYPADHVRQALGSAPKDIGSFGIAA